LKSWVTKSPSFGGMLDIHAVCAEAQIAAPHSTAASAIPCRIFDRIPMASLNNQQKNQQAFADNPKLCG
jgi:hypothetical protein